MKTRQVSTASRRTLLKWGLCGCGAAVVATLPKRLMAQSSNGVKTLTFNANDIGILNFALLLEELEAAFYAAAIKSGKITNSRELDYVRALGAHEASHVEFLRTTLGSNTLFQTADLSFNRAGLNAVLANRDTILNTAVSYEIRV